MRTPWGSSQQSKKYGPGITFYSTASHGGFRVDAAFLSTMPEYMRDDCTGSAEWFEEDCAWSMVATCFPDLFDEYDRQKAKETLANTYPDEYEKFYGVVLQPGESHTKDDRQFHAEHANDYLPLSAFGDWHEKVPKGQVGVFAGRGGRRSNGGYPDDCKWFLVPDEEYRGGKMVLSHGEECFYPEMEAIQ